MAVESEKARAFYGQSAKISPSGNVSFYFGSRLLLIDPQAGSLAVEILGLPENGLDVLFVANVSGSYSVDVDDPSGTIATLPTNRGCWISRCEGVSYRSSVSTYSSSGSQSQLPEPYSLTVGPGEITDANLRTLFDTAFLDYSGSYAVALTATILPGTLIRQNLADWALDTGSWPAGSTISLINKGRIYGRGGNGGDSDTTGSQNIGTAGGHAIRLQVPTSINNSEGEIFAGGGGGAGASSSDALDADGMGGGGGGAGIPAGSGGSSGSSCLWDAEDGTSLAPGFGGTGNMYINDPGGSGYASKERSFFNHRSGGAGGFPGMPGWISDSDTSTLRSAPGALVVNGQHLTWTDRGKAQGYVWDTVNDTFEILVGWVAANLNILRYLEAVGWNGVDVLAITVRILSGAAIFNPRRYWWDGISGSSLWPYTLDTGAGGSFPGGTTISIVNDGIVYGYGGRGGRGGRSHNTAAGRHPPQAGEPGGTAFRANFATTFDNTNGSLIGGGGGGGGASGGADNASADADRGGCGGAGRSHPRTWPFLPEYSGMGSFNDSDNVIGFHYAYQRFGALNPSFDGPSYYLSSLNDADDPAAKTKLSGTGTQGYTESTPPGSEVALQRFGGDGGDWGTAGEDAYGASEEASPNEHKTGGAAGNAVEGDSYVTWTDVGIRIGAVV